MIEIQELTKRYGSTVAVDDLSFSVKSGTVTGFLGPNGAGKSTTMRITMGLDHPLRGRVLLDGKRYGQLREPIRHVGALLEAKAAQRSRTAYHHLLWLAQTNRIGRGRVREVLELVGLESAAARRAGGFSLGMSQRLGLAAALLGDPGILILDEPANGLDPEGVRWIRTMLKKLAAEGRTVFVSSHLMSEMAITADHLIVIGRGRLLADTSMAGFIADHCRPSVRIRTPQPGLLRAALEEAGLHAVREVDGTMTVEGADTSVIGRIAADNGITLDELSARQSSLEEAFLRLTSHAAEYRAAATVAGERAS
ncbi:ATP-binding cassette domain-containing protein [Streptomyces sp. NPDC046261]|uniref:ATP-binding cassette domain-containing protein n=1 Tax=Streptomyces sp. NPDC046261 TaxID=3157200 RepID=UPI0033F3B86C